MPKRCITHCSILMYSFFITIQSKVISLNLMKRVLFAAILSLVVSGLLAQESRIELNLSSVPSNVEIMSLGIDGFAVYYRGGERGRNGSNRYDIRIFDNNLEERDGLEVQLPSRYDEEMVYRDEAAGRLYFLLSSGNDMLIIEKDLRSGKQSEMNFEINESNFDLYAFEVRNGRALIGGMRWTSTSFPCWNICMGVVAMCGNIFNKDVRKLHSLLWEYDLATGELHQADVSDLKKKPVFDRAYYGEQGKLLYSYIYASPQSEHSLILKEYERGLQNPKEYKVSLEGAEPVDASVSKWENEVMVVGGSREPNTRASNYPKRTIGNNSNYLSANTSGFYVAKFDAEGSPVFTKNYSFLDVSSYYKRKKEWVDNNLKDNRRGRRIKESMLTQANELMYIHPIYERDEDYVIIAETFHPEYHTEYYTDANGNTTTRQVFDGFNHDDILVIYINAEGEIIQDEFIEMEDYDLTYYFQPKLNITRDDADPNLLRFAYYSSSRITTYMVEYDEVVEMSNEKLNLLNSTDTKAREYYSNILPWYDTYYLFYGIQKVKRSNRSSRRNQKLLFIEVVNTDGD